ncbi:MAG: hypothetical protein FWD61_01235 [Phycisphaerales bacterium]|nr:hypothetical protein [Phycisphaerales bacterium]
MMPYRFRPCSGAGPAVSQDRDITVMVPFPSNTDVPMNVQVEFASDRDFENIFFSLDTKTATPEQLGWIRVFDGEGFLFWREIGTGGLMPPFRGQPLIINARALIGSNFNEAFYRWRFTQEGQDDTNVKGGIFVGALQ